MDRARPSPSRAPARTSFWRATRSASRRPWSHKPAATEEGSMRDIRSSEALSARGATPARPEGLLGLVLLLALAGSALAAFAGAPDPARLPALPTWGALDAEVDAAADVVHHVVKRGETMWSIAERYYGTGEEFDRVIDANIGKQMPDGRVFDRAGLIYPGWTLDIPLPSPVVVKRDGL